MNHDTNPFINLYLKHSSFYIIFVEFGKIYTFSGTLFITRTIVE